MEATIPRRNAPTVNTNGRSLIYVAACGRSGTTILGYLLGNASQVLDLGEVNEWLRFDGKPNGFGPGTENYAFWERVMARFVGYYGEPDFEELRSLQRRVDYHYAMFAQVVSCERFRRGDVARFRIFLLALYQAIFDESDAKIIVDSSKYPSRLWHLVNLISSESLLVLHLRRSSRDVIHAMQSDKQGKPKSYLSASAYYYGIEFLIQHVLKKTAMHRVIEMRYEQVMTAPESCLRLLGYAFDLDVASAIQKVSAASPLKRGFIFNGNRMRVHDKVVFRKGENCL